MSIDWWCDGPGMRRPRRDPREDDPDYYRDWSGQWVKRTTWTLENYPSTRDWDTYCKFLQETTPRERAALQAAYLRSQGLVPWRDIWVKPERAKELERQYQKNRKKEREAMERARQMRSSLDRWLWC